MSYEHRDISYPYFAYLKVCFAGYHGIEIPGISSYQNKTDSLNSLNHKMCLCVCVCVGVMKVNGLELVLNVVKRALYNQSLCVFIQKIMKP